jgi:hypothetical protein
MRTKSILIALFLMAGVSFTASAQSYDHYNNRDNYGGHYDRDRRPDYDDYRFRDNDHWRHERRERERFERREERHRMHEMREHRRWFW